MDAAETERRKEDHLRIPLEKDVQSIPNPWDAWRIRHQPLPGFDRDDVDLKTRFLGHELGGPLQITGMTGGAKRAQAFNDALAYAASEHRIAMGVGSQRAAIENPELAATYRVILDHDVPFRMANLGLPQILLWGKDAVGHCETAVSMVDAHALCIHLNYLQEAVQPEGDTNARGDIKAIASLCDDLGLPVIIKETGAGIPGEAAKALADAGVAAIDVGGLGGTSFSAVEYHRAVDQGDATKAALGQAFWDWGIPTPDSLRQCRQACPDLPLVATGGLRHGVDALRALALGADLAGYAGTVFRAAAHGPQAASEQVHVLLEGLKTGLFLSAARHPTETSEDLFT